MSGPLEGVRVVDLARLLPGGYATSLLADLGADVLKVERPGDGDGLRGAQPYDADGVSSAHRWLNRGKRSLTADLKQAAGREVLLALVARSDVLIDSFRPGVLDRLGLGRRVLEDANPGLVHVSITFHGHRAERATRAGHDINAQALAGLLSLAEGPEGGPARPYVQAVDHVVGLQAALATVAMLRERDRTGRGGSCDLAMVDAGYSLLGLAGAAFGATGSAPTANEELTGGLACYGLYACADSRYVAVGALEPVFFARLVAALGLPETLVDDQFVRDRQPALRAAIGDVFLRKPRQVWLDHLDGIDCCVTPVRDTAGAMTDLAAAARGLVLAPPETPCARVGPVPMVPGVDPLDVVTRPAPGLGQHNAEVLSELGWSQARIAAWLAGGES